MHIRRDSRTHDLTRLQHQRTVSATALAREREGVDRKEREISELRRQKASIVVEKQEVINKVIS